MKAAVNSYCRYHFRYTIVYFECNGKNRILISNSGRSWQDKIIALRGFLKARSATAVVIEKLDEIACKYLLMYDESRTDIF